MGGKNDQDGNSSRGGGGAADDDKAQCLELFLKIGLDERTAKNTIVNSKVTNNLNTVIREVS